MEGDANAYMLMKSIIEIITSQGAGWWVVPVMTIYIVIRIIRWVFRTSRGEQIDDMGESWNTSVEALKRSPGRVSETWRSRFR